MYKPRIIKNNDDTIYILVKDYRDYPIDESVEYENIIIDLNENDGKKFLVGIEIKEKDEKIDYEKTCVILNDKMTCVKFNLIEENGEDEEINNILVDNNIEIYKRINGGIIGMIIRNKNVCIEELNNSIRNLVVDK